jgi:hypothetical protein
MKEALKNRSRVSALACAQAAKLHPSFERVGPGRDVRAGHAR